MYDNNVIFACRKFIQIVESSIPRLTLDNIYVVIKDILDCLKWYKDTPYREKVKVCCLFCVKERMYLIHEES